MPSKSKQEGVRVRYFVGNHRRDAQSTLSQKLNPCPALACIAGNIPAKKIAGWRFTDKYYHARFKEVRLCLDGLIDHSACLAARGQDEQLPVLRDFICGLAAFWPESPDTDDPVKAEEHYGTLFDQAVSAAQKSGAASELSEDRKENILIGLENYIIDLAGQFSKIDQEALEGGLGICESVASGLQQTWAAMEQTQDHEPMEYQPEQGGMTMQ